MMSWSFDELDAFDSHSSLLLTAGPNSTDSVELGMVTAGGQLYVRAFRGPQSTWFRAARGHGEGSIEVAGRRYPVGLTVAEFDPAIETAYRRKYSAVASLIETSDARSATIRITPIE